jgi:hypothetical protein
MPTRTGELGGLPADGLRGGDVHHDGRSRAVDGNDRQQEHEKAFSRPHARSSTGRGPQQAGPASAMRTVAKNRGT